MGNIRFLFCFHFAAFVAAAVAYLGYPPAMAMELSHITAARLYNEIGGSSSGKKPNFVFSPQSILDVFHSAQKGADGNTRAQMDVLVGPDERFVLPPVDAHVGGEQKVQLEVANRLFVDYDLAKGKHFQEYKKLLSAEGGSAESLDFSNPTEAASRINGFVSEVTRNHIENIVDESDVRGGTKLVLANAMYFKAPWLSQFEAQQTRMDIFYTPAGPTQVSFMKGKLGKAPLLHHTEEGLTAIGLPYEDSRVRMYILMPSNIDNYESSVAATPELIDTVIQSMEASADEMAWEQEVVITMPKFKLSADDNKVDLVSLFKGLGATDMFDPEKADFSKITGKRDLVVSAYLHQADIEVDEEGTEATAATAMSMMLRSMPMPKEQIHVTVNKPFMFQIRLIEGDETFILFSGRIADPSSAQ